MYIYIDMCVCVCVCVCVWHGSTEWAPRDYYGTNSTTYIKGHGGTPLIFRNGADVNLAVISMGGNVGIGSDIPNCKLDVNGDINATIVRVNGVDINQMIKNQHVFSLYRNYISIIGGGIVNNNFFECVRDIEANLKLNEYDRPQLNVRWNISASINNGNASDSNIFFL